MGDDGKKASTPKLRLPEFRNRPGWKEKSIAALARVTQGGTPDTSKADYWGGSINWLTPAEMNRDDCPYIASTRRTLTEEGLANCSSELLPPFSVIISTRAPIGHLAINTAPMAINQGCRGLVPVENAYFLYSALLHAKPRLMDLGAGNTFKELSGSALKRFEIAAPPPAEQQRIADCLTSLDELIAAQGRKVETLKAHKNGLMQQLFPGEVEALPRLRFPEFRNAGEWEERKGGELFANRKAKGEYGLPIYSVTMRDGLVRRDSFDRTFYDIEEAAGNKKACKNDIAYNMMRMWQGACGVAPEDCLVSPAYVVLAPLEGVVPAFFEYLFKLPASLLLLTSHSRGLTKDRLRLYYDDFAKMPLRVPGKAEQQRIANCLSSLDARLTADSRKLDALKLHKRGLMQQLFPMPEGD